MYKYIHITRSVHIFIDGYDFFSLIFRQRNVDKSLEILTLSGHRRPSSTSGGRPTQNGAQNELSPRVRLKASFIIMPHTAVYKKFK